MTKSVRRLIIAAILIVVITAIGTVGGFFNVYDLINRVSISRNDNEFGGTTTVKSTFEDKVVSWTRHYKSEWPQPINAQKPYSLIEVLDDDNQIVQYTYYYLTESTVEETNRYYESILSNDDVEKTVLDAFTLYEVTIGNYDFDVKVAADGGQTEVVVSVDSLIH